MPRRPFVHAIVDAITVSAIALVPATQASAATPSATIVQQINSARAANGLPPLRTMPGLVKAARSHSLRLSRQNALNHNGFAARIRRAGISFRSAGENVAYVSGCGTPAAIEVFSAWMRSAPHRKNILSPSFRMIGTAMAVRGNCDTAFATAEFAG